MTPFMELESTLASDQEIPCTRGCGSMMAMRLDAIGRVRPRCPKCDGVSKPRRVSPDECLVPRTLVRMTTSALPDIEPGQLRCQRCAKGVDGQARFCSECLIRVQRLNLVRRCLGCGRTSARGRKQRRTSAKCALCAPTAAPVRVCLSCNRLSPRAKRGRSKIRQCSECFIPKPPRVRVKKEKTPKPPRAPLAPRQCINCGSESPRTGGPQQVKSCKECRPALIGTFDARVYKAKECELDTCSVVFMPTGPRARFCEDHRR